MPQQISVSVSNLDLFRVWRQDEDLDLAWLLSRLRGEVEQTPQMKAGEAFHKAIELIPNVACDRVEADGYIFHFDCDADIALPKFRELRISKEYGDVLVRGRVDAVQGKTVIDHKTTGQFDADRLMSGYQWRYYLDMSEADRFIWNVFVLKEADPQEYLVADFHVLEQRRYPELHNDCLRLAKAYSEFAKANLAVPAPLTS